jgi:thiamine-monophosphate kinase
MSHEPAARLVDLGERRLISEVLAPRYSGALRFGDDCANVALTETGPGVIVATTDPCPPPMAAHVGFDDPYYAGWLLATINLSDLAAAGAEPLGLLTSLNLPADLPVRHLERLLDGIDACCNEAGTAVIGGNLKETPTQDLSATALGICRGQPPLSRRGAVPGDSVVVLGDLGLFWSGVLSVRHGLVPAGDPTLAVLRNVLTPRPKVAAGLACRRAELLHCVMDNSDGLYPTLAQLAATNDVRINLVADQLSFSPIVSDTANRLDIDPVRLALGFGDWQLVGTCDASMLGRLVDTCSSLDCPVAVIGEVLAGTGVTIRHEGSSGSLLPLDSERFTRTSWFSSGLDGYIEVLRNERLVHPSV